MPLIARHFPFGEAKYQARMVDCYGYHSHDVLVIGALEEPGDLTFDFEDVRVDVTSDSLVCFPPRQRHRAVLSTEARGYCILHLEPQWLSQVMEIEMSQVQWTRTIVDPSIHMSFIQTVKAMASGEEAGEETIEEWLGDFLPLLFQPIHEASIPDATLEQVRQYIEKHWDETFTIHTVAEIFALNPYTMIRQFKQHYGTTPKKYQRDLRVHQAKALIVGGMEIAEAALHCGFYDQSHLYNYFKKIFGVSPKVYQEAFEK